MSAPASRETVTAAAEPVSVVTIDGPSGSGKGTLCQLLAAELGWHLLDSGALYRIVGLAAVKQQVSFEDEAALARLAASLEVSFQRGEPGEPAVVLLSGEDISQELRNESSGEYASKVAVYTAVRDALRQLQRSFAKAPGLIADGRDMGTEIFPDAALKIYLTASAEARAKRRQSQLLSAGQSVNLRALLEDIKARDERDMNREISPLLPASGAVILDSTDMGIDEVFSQVLKRIKNIL